MTEGKIIIYYGPTFASKTTKLLDFAEQASKLNEPYFAFRPLMDKKRYPYLQDHDSKRAIDAKLIEHPDELLDYMHKFRIMIGDEISFFGRGMVPVVKKLRENGNLLVGATIDKFARGGWWKLAPDPRQELPEYTVEDLLKLADHAELVQGSCSFPLEGNSRCTVPSRYTCIINPQASDIEVGKKNYFACCPHHSWLVQDLGLTSWQKSVLTAMNEVYSIEKPALPTIIPMTSLADMPNHTPVPKSIGIRTEE